MIEIEEEQYFSSTVEEIEVLLDSKLLLRDQTLMRLELIPINKLQQNTPHYSFLSPCVCTHFIPAFARTSSSTVDYEEVLKYSKSQVNPEC